MPREGRQRHGGMPMHKHRPRGARSMSDNNNNQDTMERHLNILERFAYDQTGTIIAIDFLKQLRPCGPWVLTAIAPQDGKIETITAKTADQIDEFVHKHSGQRNLYFSVNPTRK